MDGTWRQVRAPPHSVENAYHGGERHALI